MLVTSIFSFSHNVFNPINSEIILLAAFNLLSANALNLIQSKNNNHLEKSTSSIHHGSECNLEDGFIGVLHHFQQLSWNPGPLGHKSNTSPLCPPGPQTILKKKALQNFVQKGENAGNINFFFPRSFRDPAWLIDGEVFDS